MEDYLPEVIPALNECRVKSGLKEIVEFDDFTPTNDDGDEYYKQDDDEPSEDDSEWTENPKKFTKKEIDALPNFFEITNTTPTNDEK